MNATEKYCKAVAKELICSKATKDSFINGLKEELAQFKSSENISEIEAVYGTPLQTAEEFQQNVSAEERAKALRKNKLIKWVCIILSILLIFVLILIIRYCVITWSTAVSTFDIVVGEG